MATGGANLQVARRTSESSCGRTNIKKTAPCIQSDATVQVRPPAHGKARTQTQAGKNQRGTEPDCNGRWFSGRAEEHVA
eukprot:8106338-Pyramimonas_sp.AAC.1